MTFKELRKLFPSSEQDNFSTVIQQQQLQQEQSQDTILYQKFKGKPFWIWGDKEEHRKLCIETNGNCCFQHIIGLPRKYGKERPIYPFQKVILDKLFEETGSFQDKHLVILKSTGIGASELFLRLLCWLALKDKTYSGTDFCIITAPRLELSVSLIDRLKKLFLQKLGVTFRSKETTLMLNGVRISAFPSHNLDAMRGIAAVSFIFADEADLWFTSEENNLRDTLERYIGKSSPYIVLCSTPGMPGSLFEKLLNEPDDTCLYKKLRMDYKVGLGTIYSEQEIEYAKKSPSFAREYSLKFGGTVGNVFSEQDINAAIEKGKLYKVPETANEMNYHSKKSMGIDPGFGSSAFGVCVLEQADRQIQVLEASEYVRPDYNQMIEVVFNIFKKYGRSINKIYVDGANPSFIRGLKLAIGEDEQYEQVVKDCNKSGRELEMDMDVIPVNFSTNHREMLGKVKAFLERDGGHIAINPKFDKLIASFRTAMDKGDGALDKSLTSYDDIFDAMRLALSFYDFRSSEEANRRYAAVESFEMDRRFS